MRRRQEQIPQTAVISNETGIPEATDDGTYSESGTDESAGDESSTDGSPHQMRVVQRNPQAMRVHQMRAVQGNPQEMRAQQMRAVQRNQQAMKAAPMRPEFRKQQRIQNLLRTRAQMGSDQLQTVQKSILPCSVRKQRTITISWSLFAKGEYEGDADSLLAATEDTEAVATVTLDEQTAKRMWHRLVEKDYYDILKDGTDSYVGRRNRKLSRVLS